MLTALRELLRRKQRSAFIDELPKLVDPIENVICAVGIEQPPMSFQILHNMVNKLRGMSARAQSLIHEDEESAVEGVSTTVVNISSLFIVRAYRSLLQIHFSGKATLILRGQVTSTFPRRIITPGGQHGNDKKEVVDIKLLSTEVEIRRDHPEFLPSTDFDQPHFLADQAQRHLDTHFRLIRHDFFGELKDALGGLVLAVENAHLLLEQPKLSPGNIRAQLYADAFIKYFSFHSPTPYASRNRQKSGGGGRSPNDSKKVYSSACCWFDRGKISLLFFTVPDKQTDPKSSHGLCFPDYLGTFTARLETTSQHDVELMICNSPGNQMVILIEVPGGVPASPISLAYLEASSTIHSRVPPALAI